MKIKFIFIILLLAQVGYSQEVYELKNCNCKDYITQTKPKLQGEYKRVCNGKTIEQGNFVDGVKDGIWQSWSKKGNLIRSFNYSNGQLNGEVKFYYVNGTKKFEGSFQNGLKTGIWNFYSESGKVIKSGKYENGIPVGVWQIFNWTGEKVLFSYDYSQKKYLKRGKESKYFEDLAIMQNDNTEEWYILVYPKRVDTAKLMPIEGYILCNDIYTNLMEVPLDIWDTYLQFEIDVSVTIKSGEIQSLTIDTLASTTFDNPAFTFLINTNKENKLKNVEHGELSLKLLEYKILEVLLLMGPWVGNDDTFTIKTAYVVNKFGNNPFK